VLTQIDPEPAEVLSHAFFRLVRGFRLLERGAKCCEGVTLPQCTLLETLASDGPQRLSALAKRLGVKVSTATRLVDTLEREELVARETQPGDARGVRVKLTPEGARLTKKLSAAGSAFSALILAALPADEREGTVAAIERVAGIVESLPNCCG
jgi:DNA-binding MarR family transcriptional regulator